MAKQLNNTLFLHEFCACVAHRRLFSLKYVESQMHSLVVLVAPCDTAVDVSGQTLVAGTMTEFPFAKMNGVSLPDGDVSVVSTVCTLTSISAACACHGKQPDPRSRPKRTTPDFRGLYRLAMITR